MKRWQAELVLDARANLGEGPLWDNRTEELLWVDIMVGIVHRFDPASSVDRAFDVGQPVGAVVPRSAGGYAFALRDGFAVGDAGGVTPHAPCQNAEDVDCNGHVEGLDALRVLRWFIGAPMAHPGCPEVGDPLA